MLGKPLSSAKRILLLAIGAKGTVPEVPDFLQHLRALGNLIEVRRVNEAKSYRQIIQSFMVTRDIQKFDLVIATEYFSTFGLCLRSLISRKGARLATIGFNVSRRYLSTNLRFVDFIINRIFRALSLVVVHSRAECELFCRVHNLDPARFKLVPWGYDIPRSFQNNGGATSPFVGRPFICMIGRNNRDFATLSSAIRGINVPAVFVTSSSEKLGPPTSAFIKVLFDIPFDDCLEIMQQSTVSLILLKDAARGAGHITAVSAMLLGKPQIFSDADVLKDYVIDGEHGISVPMGDVVAVRQAVIRLIGDEELLQRFGKQAKEFATSVLSNDAFQKNLADIFVRFLTEQEMNST
jgi:Glycosyl transferases group 1